MGKQKKVIENYEIVQILEEYENAYSILLAKHITEKKYYVLKKLTIKGGNNQALYSVLLNEANILKTLKHENIVTCFRMLKTSSNLYIIYSYLEGNSLEEVLELGPKVMTLAQKETIAQQLCLVLTELQKNQIAHLYINPTNILVGKKMTIMLRQFIYAMQIPEEGEIDVKRKIPRSEFVAPEVKRGIASFEGDIYSFGRILEKLQFRKSKKEQGATDPTKRVQQLQQMIEGMTAKDRHHRWSLNEVYQCIFHKLKKVKRMRSLSQNKFDSSGLTTMSMTSTRGVIGSKKLYEMMIMKLLRQRALSFLLLKLFRTVTVALRFNSQYTVILGILLLKKSTKMLANLGKYLHYGKNDIQIDINAKDHAKFSKSADYVKICEIIDKEVSLQRKEFDSAIQTIFVNNPQLLRKNNDFKKEMKEEQVDPVYLSNCIREYLIQIAKKEGYINQISEDWLADLTLLSNIAVSKSFQDFYRANLNGEQIAIEEQVYMKKLKENSKLILADTIAKNIGVEIKGIKDNKREERREEQKREEQREPQPKKIQQQKLQMIQI